MKPRANVLCTTIALTLVSGQAAWAQQQAMPAQTPAPAPAPAPAAQGGSVQGRVTAAYGEPLWGVTVSARGTKMPLLDQYLTATDPADPAFPRTPELLWQNEAGLKLGGSWYALAAVAYWMQIENFPSQDARVDPVTGDTRFVTVYAGKARTLGLELEGAVQPVKWFRGQGMLTLQDPRYTEFNEGANDFTGNRIRRIPQVIGDLTGTFMFGNASLGINWSYVGHRFSNNANTVDLPGFGQFNVRAGYTYENVTLDLQLFNALNSIGLTEGNPRVDESLGAVPDIFLARPVLPRRLMLSLTARL